MLFKFISFCLFFLFIFQQIFGFSNYLDFEEKCLRLPPPDTTYIFEETCDIENIGTTISILTNQYGEDSVSYTITSLKGPISNESLVLHLPFNGNLSDMSGWDNVINISSSMPKFIEDRFGFPNRALLFKGEEQNYFTIDHKPWFFFTPLDTFTLSFWIKIAEEQTITLGATDNTIINKWKDTFIYPNNFPFRLGILNQNNGIYPGSIFGGEFGGKNYPGSCYTGGLLRDTTDNRDGNTHFIVYKKMGYILTLTVDNILVDLDTSGIQDTCNISNEHEIYIGCRNINNSSFGYCFTGEIDDLRIYRRSLSDEEIDALFNEPPPSISYIKRTICEDELWRVLDFGEFSAPIDTFFILENAAQDDCDSVIYLSLILDEFCDIPTAFSPFNNDGINDTFIFPFLTPENYTYAKLTVYDRNGIIVYYKNGYENDWDGTTNSGEKLPFGTYYYTLKMNFSETRVKKGFVMLITE